MARGPSPQWAPDPSGRHELRYWSGSAWTPYVNDDGTPGIDPPRSVPVQLTIPARNPAADPASPAWADHRWRRNAEMIIAGCVLVAVLALILNYSADDSLAHRSGAAATSPTATDRAFAEVPSVGASDTPPPGASDAPIETTTEATSGMTTDATTIAAAAPSLGARTPRQVEETPSFLPPTAAVPTPADLFTPTTVPTPTVTVFRTVTVTRTSTPPAAAGPAGQTFANCDALHERYPHGVGRLDALDKTRGTPPVTTFERNDALYSANIKSDADKDGIACEQP